MKYFITVTAHDSMRVFVRSDDDFGNMTAKRLSYWQGHDKTEVVGNVSYLGYEMHSNEIKVFFTTVL